MNARILLRVTVLAVMVGLGLAAGMNTGSSQPPPGKGVCRTKPCSKYAQINDHSDCSGTEAPKNCIFTSSGENLIYCDKTTGTCVLQDPIQGNQCTGYCQTDSTVTCYSPATSKCQSPIQEG